MRHRGHSDSKKVTILCGCCNYSAVVVDIRSRASRTTALPVIFRRRASFVSSLRCVGPRRIVVASARPSGSSIGRPRPRFFLVVVSIAVGRVEVEV